MLVFGSTCFVAMLSLGMGDGNVQMATNRCKIVKGRHTEHNKT